MDIYNSNKSCTAKTVTFTSNSRPPGKAVTLNQTPPAPPNQPGGRNHSDLYKVAIPSTTRRFTRNGASPATPQSPQRSTVNQNIITLDQKRTGPRAKNEYVDTPSEQATTDLNQQPTYSHKNNSSQVPIITNQPKKSNHRTDPKLMSVEDEPMKPLAQHEDTNTITCKLCGKCKCEQCRTPRELPKTWICNRSYECSLQKTVECCTCLCVVQCCFQTIFNDPEDEDDVADDPCACCSQRHCCKRWMCMGLLSLCLPGLCCYPVMKGGLYLCTLCYNGYKNPACKCRKDKLQGSNRMLLDSESSSTT